MVPLILPFRPVIKDFPISAPFGEVRTKNDDTYTHNGIDFAVPVGTEVYAMIDGTVFRAGWEKDPMVDPNNMDVGFGLRIWQTFMIPQNRHFYGWYGHLSKLLVKEGEEIKAGQLIGLSGDTGRTYSSKHKGKAPHLHVQAREKNTNAFFDIAWENG